MFGLACPHNGQENARRKTIVRLRESILIRPGFTSVIKALPRDTLHPLTNRVQPQVPPLRYASVGMTKFSLMTSMKSCRMGWKETAGPSTPLRSSRDDKV